MLNINDIAERAKQLLCDTKKIKVGRAELLTATVVKIYYISYEKVDLSRIKYHLESEYSPLKIFFTCIPISVEEKTKIFLHQN